MIFVPVYANRDLVRVQAEIRTAEQQQRNVAGQVAQSDARVRQTQTEMVRVARRLETIENDRARMRETIANLESRTAQLNQSIAANQDRLAHTTAALLVISSSPIMGADDAANYARTAALMAGIAESFNRDMRAAADAAAELERTAEQRRREQARLDATAARYATQRADFDRLLRTRTLQNEQLRAQQAQLQGRLRTLSAQARNISELATGVAGDVRVTGDARLARGRLRPPVSGRLVRPFGHRNELGLTSDGWRIATRPGALVSAPADGRIEFADVFRGYSRVVIIRHQNNYYSVMVGLSSTYVLIGQDVLAGEPIGRMPNRNAELYLEMRRGNRAVDPARHFTNPVQ